MKIEKKNQKKEKGEKSRNAGNRKSPSTDNTYCGKVFRQILPPH
tara:strand:+ start:2265 stop:2396 length:132 start_codon:yes stop_codon:yes gene_type:complete